MKKIFPVLFLLSSCINSNSPAVPATGSSDSDSIAFRQRMTGQQEVYANPNSPYRNETAAIKVYDSILASPYYSAAEKFGIQKKLQLARQNRVGEPANDFTYYDPAGSPHKLYALKASYTLLYFYNPECNACKEMKATLTSSFILTRNIQAGRLKVLAIYPDPDTELWKRHLPEFPKEWVHGRDDQRHIWENKVYDLRAIPTLYLLDKGKKVLLKDCMLVEEIEKKLEE